MTEIEPGQRWRKKQGGTAIVEIVGPDQAQLRHWVAKVDDGGVLATFSEGELNGDYDLEVEAAIEAGGVPLGDGEVEGPNSA